MKKRYIIIGIVLLVYVVFMIAVFGLGLFKNKTYLIIGTAEKLKYENGKYVDIMPSEKTLYQGAKFDVYDSKGHVGNYILKIHEGRWHAFSDDYDFVKLSPPIFAIKSNKKYSMPTYEIDEFNDEDIDILNGILEKKDIGNYNLSVNQKISIDLNGDGDKETLYSASNLFEDNTAKNYFSIVYYVKDDKVNIIKDKIYKKISGYDYDGETYDLTRIIDLKDDGKLELVITRSCFSNVCDNCSEIYTLKWGKYKSLRTCE